MLPAELEQPLEPGHGVPGGQGATRRRRLGQGSFIGNISPLILIYFPCKGFVLALQHFSCMYCVHKFSVFQVVLLKERKTPIYRYPLFMRGHLLLSVTVNLNASGALIKTSYSN